jgi:hypothetical protein
MKAIIKYNILYINKEDLPQYQKGKSIVRNNYFWALKSISDYAPMNGDWEFSIEIWIALNRMLLFFTNSGYLGYRETMLEFSDDTLIPDILRSSSTKL